MKIILFRDINSADKRAVVVIGNGLVGSAISERFAKRITSKTYNCNLEWNKTDTIAERVKENVLKYISNDITRIDWIWSAGKAGFGASDDEIKNEFQLFEKCSFTILSLHQNVYKNSKYNYHFISSAGGLFEGQNVTHIDEIPIPKRPYGQLKLLQEQFIQENFQNNCYIYRLSTVYGQYNINFRIGLISALIKNTLSSKITFIYARPNTKRDYIWTEDIADYISLVVLDSTIRKDRINFLVSGKPTSIFEIITSIQRFSKNKVLQQYKLVDYNSDKIIYSDNIKPKHLNITPMDVCLRNIFSKILYNK